MKDATELQNALNNFTGTEEWHYNPLYKWMVYTDGVKFFAENAGNGAYWLLDILGTELRELAKKEDFLHIALFVGSTAAITVDDGNHNILWSKGLDWTDCPKGKWEFYLTNEVLLLPSEY